MLRPEVPTCPSCAGDIRISRYHCPSCDLAVEGSFERNRFSRLSPQGQDFLVLFVKNRGNLREIERELDISYPTVRNRLNRVIAELGLSDEQRWTAEEIAAERKTIVADLHEGKVSPAEAEDLLRALNQLSPVDGGAST